VPPVRTSVPISGWSGKPSLRCCGGKVEIWLEEGEGSVRMS
jgi:hypothetical protein